VSRLAAMMLYSTEAALNIPPEHVSKAPLDYPLQQQLGKIRQSVLYMMTLRRRIPQLRLDLPTAGRETCHTKALRKNAISSSEAVHLPGER
jgi:hypothetical protein